MILYSLAPVAAAIDSWWENVMEEWRMADWNYLQGASNEEFARASLTPLHSNHEFEH